MPVAAVVENYVYHYAYFTPALYERVTGETLTYNGVLANIDGLTEDNQDAWAQRLLSDTRVYTVVFLSDMFDTIWDSLSVLNYVVGILILSAAVLAFVVMLNLTNINITERMRELATLKVLGFYDPEVYAYVNRESVVLTLIGTLFGLAGGIVLHSFIIRTVEVDAVMFGREVSVMSFVYAVALLSLIHI